MGNKVSNKKRVGSGTTPGQPASPIFANASLNEIVIKKIIPLRDDHIFVDIMEPYLLPMEILVQILSILDLKTLYRVHRVCKYLFNATSGNSIVWQIKAKEKPPGQKKRSDQTWKQFYFVENIKLFPVLGLELGASMEEIKAKHPDAQITKVPNRDTFRAIIDGKYTLTLLPLDGTTKVIFDMFNINLRRWDTSPHPNQIPEEWQAQGLTADKSFNEYKKFLTRWTGNFTARVYGGVGELNVHKRSEDKNSCMYSLKLTFYFTRYDEDTPGTLDNIVVCHHINMKRCPKKGHYHLYFE